MGFYSVIDNRAHMALKQIASCFQEKNKPNQSTIPLIKGIRQIEPSYFLQNKWVGRIYIYQWRVVIEGRKPENVDSIRLKYEGKKQGYFHSGHSNIHCHELENHPAWKEIQQVIDFEKLELTYNEEEQAWDALIWPNFGDYIWMLIPPVRYYRKPLPEEKVAMTKLLKMFVDVLGK